MFFEDGGYSDYKEYIVVYDLDTEELAMLEIDENEAMYYTEARPRIAVENDRIYYYVQAEADGAESLRSMALDGTDDRTLVKSAPLY